MVVVGRWTASSTGMDGAVWMEDGCNQPRADELSELVAETVMMMEDAMSRPMSTLWLLYYDLKKIEC